MTNSRDNGTLKVVRIQIEGVTASFRYPHFLIGRQPTFSMPPPSTIYGLISGALGDFPCPSSIRFAYHFTCERQRVDDVETIWFISPNTSTRGASKEFNLDATSNVLPRELLIHPRLTLYIASEDTNSLFNAFRKPHYVPVLGRSQDMVSYRRVDKIELRHTNEGRFDATLLPHSFFTRMPYSPAVHMPRFISPHNRWKVEWSWYMTLKHSVRVGSEQHFMPLESDELWADPDTMDPNSDTERLLYFHSFID